MTDPNPRRDYLLMYLALPGQGHVADQIRVMKGMFLFTQEGPPEVRGLYAFEPYDWGPFDSRVYRDLDALESDGLIISAGLEANRRGFALTTKGRQLAAELLQAENPGVVESLGEIKTFTTSLGFVPLLRAIYEKYPDQAKRSLLR